MADWRVRLLVVDGTNIFVRAREADARGSQLQTTAGVASGGLALFVSSLARWVKATNPREVVVCWDSPGGCQWRRDLLATYKFARTGSTHDDDGGCGLGDAQEFCRLARIAQVSLDGFEADDLIAYVLAHHPGPHPAVVLSGDKDLCQLVTADITQIRPGCKPERWGVAEVVDKWGCDPHQLPTLLALTGDASDGIEGVRGVGPKKAAKLISNHGWPDLLGELDADDGDRVAVNRQVIDLTSAANRVVQAIGDLDLDCRFSPTGSAEMLASRGLAEWFERWELAQVAERWREGRLWR